MKRGQPLVWRNADSAGRQFESWIDRAILVRGAVIIAEGDEWPHLQAQALRGLRMIIPGQLVLDDCGVFALNHEHGLFDFKALNLVGENGKRIEPKLLQVFEALRMDRTGVAVCGQVNGVALNEERLFVPRKQCAAANGRLGSGDEQAVIAPSVQANDG